MALAPDEVSQPQLYIPFMRLAGEAELSVIRKHNFAIDHTRQIGPASSESLQMFPLDPRVERAGPGVGKTC